MTKHIALKRTIQTALIIAMALVLRQFSYMVPMGGAGGLRISPSIFISRIPSVIFGPLYGAITSGLIDVIGLIIRPEGAFIPLLTVTAVCGGALAGFLWRFVDRIDIRTLKRCMISLFIALGIVGMSCHAFTIFFPHSYIGSFLTSLKKIGLWTVGFEVAAAGGLLLMLIEYLIGRRRNSDGMFIKLFAAMFVANILVTTVNTFVLMAFTPSLSVLGFWVFYVPRFIEEVISTILQCFCMNYLIKLYNNTLKNC